MIEEKRGIAAARGAEGRTPRPSRKRKTDKMETILVVDDNREIVDSLGKLLAIEGYEILTAYDGMEALDKRFSEGNLPMVLDIHRPNLCADFKE